MADLGEHGGAGGVLSPGGGLPAAGVSQLGVLSGGHRPVYPAAVPVSVRGGCPRRFSGGHPPSLRAKPVPGGTEKSALTNGQNVV